ncbi:MAG: endospore germination permease [Kyrpidia sp.]|nr:endospore germination permease [Kyrpidia sp.]
MMHTGYIGTKEARSFLAIVLSAPIALTLPQDLALTAGRAAWLSTVVALLVALAAWGLFSRIAEMAPGYSVVQMAGVWWGAPGRWAVGLVLWGYFLLITALVTRAFVETVIGTILPRTPVHVVMLLFMVVTVYMAYYGLETLSRLSQLLSRVLLMGFLLLILMDLRWMDVRYLYPLLGPGLGQVVSVGVMKSSYFSEVLVLGLMLPGLRVARDARRVARSALLVSGVLMIVMVLGYTMSFPPPSGADNPFPFYQMGRLIYLGRFVQRLEAIFDFLWVLSAAVYMAGGLWASTQSLAQACDLPVYRPLVFAMAVLVYGIASLPADYVQTTELTNAYLRSWGWVMLVGMPAVLRLGATWGRRGRREG